MALIVLPARLTHALSAGFASSLGEVFKAASSAAQSQSAAIPLDTIVADGAALSQFDSSALAVLLECRRQALACGKNFMAINIPPRLQQLASLYGVQTLLGLPTGI